MARSPIKHDALTLKELKKEITESYTPEIEVMEVDSMLDVKTWMEPLQQEISGHIYHHQFKVKRNGEDGQDCTTKSGQHQPNGCRMEALK